VIRSTWATYLLSGSSLGNSQTDTEDSVGTQLSLVWSSIELDQELVDLWLVLNIDVFLDESRANDIVDVGNSFCNTFASPFGLISIAELNSLVLA
jgi:hypothetical protein